MVRKLAPMAILGVAAALIVLTGSPPAGAVVPEGFSEVVVLGTNSVEIQQDVDVLSGDVVANDASPGPTLVNGFELSVDKKVAIAGSLQGDSVAIGKNSTVAGDVAYNDLDNDGSIAGAEITPLGLPVFGVLPLFHTGPSDGPDVVVPDEQSLTLAPGTYGDVTVGHHGTLVLSGGVYNLGSLTVDHTSVVAFEAASDVRIAGRLGLAHHVAFGPADGSGVTAAEIVVYVGGTDETGGPPGQRQRAAQIDQESSVHANLYVPNGTVYFDHHTAGTGAFLGLDVFVGHHSTIALDTFFFNRPPVAGDDSATVAEGGSTSVLDSGETSLLANDTDPNLDNLSVSATPVTPPAHGAVVLNPDGTFTYTHDGSETPLVDSFEYGVCDDGVEPGPLCDVGLVAITIIPVNDPPDAQDDAATTDEDVPVEIDVLANDSDVDGNLVPSSVTVVSGPANGTTSVNATTGAVTYSPALNFNGSDSFDYEVCDDGSPTPAECSTANVSITVNPVNDDPVADPQTLNDVPTTTTTTITLTGSDVDGDSLTFSIVNGPFHGTLTNLTSTGPTSATVDYTPDATFDSDLTDLFEFQVDDGAGGTDTATVTLFAEAVNDPPNARSDSAFVEPGGTVTTLAGGATSVLANDDDPEGDNLTVTTTPVSGPSNAAAFTLNADGTFSYTHDGGASTTDSFVYEVCDDGTPVECATATVSIGIRQLQVTVSVTKSGPGAADSTVLSSPAGIDCGTICSASFSTSDSIFLIAEPADGFAFDFWTGDADCSDGLLTPSTDVSCEAVFKDAPPPPVGDAAITITKAGTGSGVVTSDPAGIDCGTVCTATFTAFTNVTLIATPDPGSEFVAFSGDPDCADGVVSVDADKTCTATFDLLPTNTFTLTVEKAGTGDGAVASSPAGINCGGVCSADYEDGTVVTLFVRPEPGSTFIGWSGDCTGAGFSTTVTMDADKTCTANFQ